MKTRKKWLRKTTAICTAALLGTAAIPDVYKRQAAGCTAAVEKQAWDLVIFLRLIYKFFQFFLIVSFIQQYYDFLSASSQMLFIYKM